MPSAPVVPVERSQNENRSGGFDLGSWTEKLSGFGSKADSRPAQPVRQQTSPESGLSEGPVQQISDVDQLRVEWHQFIEELVRKNQNVMVSHLHSCELSGCSSNGLLELSCCRKFSFEELLHDSQLLEKELSIFYQLPLKLHILYDAQKDACTREKTVFTLFEELSQKNEVVRFLIREFGGELVY